VVQTMPAPKRPWGPLTWRRRVDYDQACLSLPQLAAARLGSTPQGRAWATQRRQPLQTKAAGLTRV